ncbi:poly-gamma-glutamate synthase PgsB, partial [Streptomyces sp. NPDC056254]
GEEFMRELLGHLGPSSSLVAIGNIHGQGEVLLEHLAELPADGTSDSDDGGRQDPYPQVPDARSPYGQDPYDRAPGGQDPYANSPYPRDAYPQGPAPDPHGIRAATPVPAWPQQHQPRPQIHPSPPQGQRHTPGEPR